MSQYKTKNDKQDKSKQRKKLLYIVTKSNWGGAQKYVYDLASSQINKRYDVTVMLGGDGELLSALLASSIKVVQLQKIKRDIGIVSDLFATIELYLKIKEISPDIVHLNSSKVGLLGSLISRMLKVETIIFTAHGWPFMEKRLLLSNLLLRISMWLTVLMSHRTIIIAGMLKKELRAPTYLSNKLQTIYNGLKNYEYKKLPKLSEGSDVTHVVSVGELHPNKNHLSVIKILKHIKKVHYHIIGSGELEEKLKSEVKRCELEDKVTFYGHVKDANMLLPQFDIFIMPSHKEGLPYVIIEALRAGLPIISRPVGGIPEILDGVDHAIMYKHNNELINLLTNWKPLVTNWTDKRFTYDNMVNETMNLYISMGER
jgi:glycosyltransferase involved in cell wall biosynthesis